MGVLAERRFCSQTQSARGGARISGRGRPDQAEALGPCTRPSYLIFYLSDYQEELLIGGLPLFLTFTFTHRLT